MWLCAPGPIPHQSSPVQYARLWRERSVEARLPVLERLARRAVDEVEAHRETRLARPLDDLRHAVGVVGAVERRERVRDGGLHAEGHARDAAVGEASERVGVHGVGVRLGRHLGTGRESERVPHRPEHRDEVIGRQQRRGAAAEEHRRRGTLGQTRAVEHLAREADLPRRLTCEVLLPGAEQLGRGVRVEVAVAAAHAAERHVEIDAECAVLGILAGARGERAVGGRGLALRQLGPHGPPRARRRRAARRPRSRPGPASAPPAAAARRRTRRGRARRRARRRGAPPWRAATRRR